MDAAYRVIHFKSLLTFKTLETNDVDNGLRGNRQTDRQTHTHVHRQDKYCNPPVHARRGLINMCIAWTC